MSLVAYAASSEDESDNDEDCVSTEAVIVKSIKTQEKCMISGHISDEDEDFVPENAPLQQKNITVIALALPKPINASETKSIIDEVEENVAPTFAKLPMPRAADINIVEEDDEFLHKKEQPIDNNMKPPQLAITKGPVKISIPSLKEFSDEDLTNKGRIKNESKNKTSGLLSILPKAKSEQNFSISRVVTSEAITSTTTLHANNKKPTLIPDAVKQRRPAQNTECVDGIKVAHKKTLKTQNKKLSIVNCSDSEGSEEENASGDFFSLNSEDKLPEVCTNEINAMVAKRAAQIAEVTKNYLNSTTVEESTVDNEEIQDDDMRQAQKRYYDQQLDAEAMQALEGSNAKRRRKQQQIIQVTDISSEEVLPNREEWMRTALASSTTYQPRGELTDEEPAAGTRRKHQITYLAHKAKSNEAELQAMWAANRQNRRATQSKYGF